MAFDECQLPTDISYGSQGGPEYKTVVTVMASGAEQRTSLWPRGRLRVNLTKDLQTPAKKDALLVFYRARGGRARGFRYKDWADYKVVGSVDGALDNSLGGTTLQLTKTYIDVGHSEVRAIYKPVAGQVTLYKNGVLFPAGGNWSVDTTTGLVSLNQAWPGASFYWVGQFDVPVRFDNDLMQMTATDIYSTWNLQVIEIMDIS